MLWQVQCAILVLLLCTGCSGKHFEPLTQPELNRQYVATALTLVDWKQTQQIVKDDNLYEMNPLLGRYPSRDKVDTLIPLGILSQWAITYYLPKKYRKTWQYFVIGAETTAVVNNYSVGIRIDF